MRKSITILFLFVSALSYGQSFSGSMSFSKPSLSAVDAIALDSSRVYVESYVTSNGGAAINAYRILLDDVNPPVDTLLYSPLNNLIIGWTPYFIWDAKTGLSSSTTYYIKVCASNIVGETCTSVVSVTTPSSGYEAPSVTTSSATSIDTTSATLNGNVTSDGGDAVTERGFYYSTVYPTDDNITSGSGTGAFNSPITGLEPNTTYYVQAYAINSVGETRGDVVSFTTSALPTTLPVVTTTTPSTNVTSSGAVTAGNVTYDGGETVTERGICFANTSSPTTADNKVVSGSGTGVFTSAISGLYPSTTYYYRAYAINENGTSYGTVHSFTTLSAAGLATVVTDTPATSIGTSTATVSGSVTDDGGSTVTTRGICFDVYPLPTTGRNSGSGEGSFSINLTGLQTGTLYYYRSFAVNAYGIIYGTQYTFTTLRPTSVPVVSTLTAINITQVSAIAGGNISYDGNSGIMQNGVCFSTSPTPTISDSKVTSAISAGEYYVLLSGLSPSTTYYCRAYATNAVGTAYGNIYSFTTSASLAIPTVTTAAVTNITEISAHVGGNVTADGGASVTTRGVVINTTGSPSLYSYTHVTSTGTGTGAFTDSVLTLTPSTTYYVRAYAINSQGTAYGNEVSFTTSAVSYPCSGTISYPGGQSYPTEIQVDLGSEIGTSTVKMDARHIPDYCIVYFSGSIAVDIGYRGDRMFDYNGTQRSAFKASLNGKTDPKGTYTYPDFTKHPEDGYPRITDGVASVRFFKSNTSRYATIKVFAPMTSTIWDVSISCPE